MPTTFSAGTNNTATIYSGGSKVSVIGNQNVIVTSDISSIYNPDC